LLGWATRFSGMEVVKACKLRTNEDRKDVPGQLINKPILTSWLLREAREATDTGG
jgi:hypothetical protein